ncbi:MULTISPECIES: phage antirepressor [unclassified Microbacterium]|uniref:phage antirepressor n=1 Tax=unclassified Microbacterium TaxID=2609290 RepID=UPI0030101D9F
MSALEVFKYGEHHVRTVVVNGEPWFVLADLARVLEIAAPGRLAARLDEDVRQTHTLQTAGGSQRMVIVSEPGMYEVVLRSDKPEARRFRWWITNDVLPTIRKTGRYGSDVDMLAALPSAKLLRLAAEAAERAEAAEAKIALDAPKVEAYDTFMDADGTYGVGAVAKMLGLSQNKLFDLLRNAGVLIAKGAMRNTPYQKYMQYFSVVAHPFERSNGERSVSYTTKVQPSGVDFIRRKLGIHAALSAEVVAS